MSRIAPQPGDGVGNREAALPVRLSNRVRQAWQIELVRLVGLTLYYLAIIAGLIWLYGGAPTVPAPYVYQGF